ncbi:hypothetical protein [Streptomyces sp. NPDC050355]|uniref:hypothetical protein n=1 Tax=Streptomyces sp. NPDC050355 TaxID=3365609 RepID=UPI0037BBFB05
MDSVEECRHPGASMEAADVVQVLEGLRGPRAVVTAGRVCVYVPAIDDTVRIDAAEVRRCKRIRTPNGDPAVEFVTGDEGAKWPLIVTPDDVVHRPVDTRAVLDSALEYRIADAPHLVAYTELARGRRGCPDLRTAGADRVERRSGHPVARTVLHRRGHAGRAAAGAQRGVVGARLGRPRRRPAAAALRSRAMASAPTAVEQLLGQHQQPLPAHADVLQRHHDAHQVPGDIRIPAELPATENPPPVRGEVSASFEVIPNIPPLPVSGPGAAASSRPGRLGWW